MVYGAHGHGCSQGPRDRRPRGHHLRRGHLQGHDDLRRDHRGERHHPADAGVVRVRRLLPPEGGGGGERHPGRASQRVWHRHSHRRRARSSLGARHHGGLHDVADNVGRRGGLRARGRDHRPVGCQCGHRHGLRPVGPELHRDQRGCRHRRCHCSGFAGGAVRHRRLLLELPRGGGPHAGQPPHGRHLSVGHEGHIHGERALARIPRGQRGRHDPRQWRGPRRHHRRGRGGVLHGKRRLRRGLLQQRHLRQRRQPHLGRQRGRVPREVPCR
mmetsp:Transcript_8201/g.26962  ORF Transcript_8201/g.26962 Transcript_8201/m.26962 type:complete len:271 (-) Transcript_8201:474-1286(-)